MNRRLLAVLLLALVFRLGFALTQDSLAPYTNFSADTGWYLVNGYALITGHYPGEIIGYEARLSPTHYLTPYTLVTSWTVGYTTQVSQVSSPPLYLVLVGVAQALFSPSAAIQFVRVVQVLLATATCFFAYRLALKLTRRENLGLLCALVIAISPVFIIESAQILTETLFVFLLTGSIWLYIESITAQRRTFALLPLAALLLGMATLTRAIILLFPFGLALHLLLVYGWRRGLGRAAALLLVYALVVSTWTVYTVTQWNRFVIAGDGLPAFLYLGITGWTSAQQVDEQLADQSPTGNYIEAASNTISSDPLAWVQRRVGELAGAYLQPHGTTFFPGESLRELALDWLRDDRSPAGLVTLLQGESFWQKLTVYLFHYVALAAGLVGVWRTRHRWRVALPMLGLIAYITLAHLVLYAEPRYLFPMEIFWWVFAVASFYQGDVETQRVAG